MSHESIKKPQYFIVLNFCNETCKRWHDKKRDRGGKKEPNIHAWMIL